MVDRYGNLITIDPKRTGYADDDLTIGNKPTRSDDITQNEWIEAIRNKNGTRLKALLKASWSEALWLGVLLVFLINVAYLLWPQGAITLSVKPHPQTLLPVLVNSSDNHYELMTPVTDQQPAQTVSHIRTTGHSYSGKKVFNGVININTATLSQWQQLPGIGPKMAERIIAYRKQHGAFHSIDELQNVEGIGPKKMAKLASHCRI